MLLVEAFSVDSKALFVRSLMKRENPDANNDGCNDSASECTFNQTNVVNE